VPSNKIITSCGILIVWSEEDILWAVRREKVSEEGVTSQTLDVKAWR
jgi:hypothetical protein